MVSRKANQMENDDASENEVIEAAAAIIRT